MKTLKIKFKSFNFSKNSVVLIDGKSIKFQKDRFENRVYEYTTMSDTVNLKIFMLNELNRKGWFLIALFHYIISLFGIFNPPYDKFGYDFNYETNIDLNEISTVEIKFNFAKNNIKFLSFSGENTEKLDNETNVIKQNEVLIKRAKIYRVFRNVMYVALLLLIVGLIVYFILNR